MNIRTFITTIITTMSSVIFAAAILGVQSASATTDQQISSPSLPAAVMPVPATPAAATPASAATAATAAAAVLGSNRNASAGGVAKARSAKRKVASPEVSDGSSSDSDDSSDDSSEDEAMDGVSKGSDESSSDSSDESDDDDTPARKKTKLSHPLTQPGAPARASASHQASSSRTSNTSGKRPWDDWCKDLQAYVEAHPSATGVLRSHITGAGHRLGSWVATQRALLKKGKLTAAQDQQLRAIKNSIWDSYSVRSWDDNYKDLQAYAAANPNANRVPQKYATADGYKLGLWVQHVRTTFKNGTLSAAQKQKLAAIRSLQWQSRVSSIRSWDDHYKDLQAYAAANPKAVAVPARHQTSDGHPLGTWARHQKQALKDGTLQLDRAELLRAIPSLKWGTKPAGLAREWEDWYKDLQAYTTANPAATNVPFRYKTADGHALGNWVNSVRGQLNKDQLAPARKQQLIAIKGLQWQTSAVKAPSWDDNYKALQIYAAANPKAISVPVSHKTVEGHNLGAWFGTQKQTLRKGTLTSEREKLLRAIPGLIWSAMDAETHAKPLLAGSVASGGAAAAALAPKRAAGPKCAAVSHVLSLAGGGGGDNIVGSSGRDGSAWLGLAGGDCRDGAVAMADVDGVDDVRVKKEFVERVPVTDAQLCAEIETLTGGESSHGYDNCVRLAQGIAVFLVTGGKASMPVARTKIDPADFREYTELTRATIEVQDAKQAVITRQIKFYRLARAEKTSAAAAGNAITLGNLLEHPFAGYRQAPNSGPLRQAIDVHDINATAIQRTVNNIDEFIVTELAKVSEVVGLIYVSRVDEHVEQSMHAMIFYGYKNSNSTNTIRYIDAQNRANPIHAKITNTTSFVNHERPAGIDDFAPFLDVFVLHRRAA